MILYSKYGPWTSSICISQVLIRNTGYQAHPTSTESNLHLNKIPRLVIYTKKSLRSNTCETVHHKLSLEKEP